MTPDFAEETFVCEVEAIREEMRENEVVVEGEYITWETMIDEWGWTELLAPCFCPAKSRLGREPKQLWITARRSQPDSSGQGCFSVALCENAEEGLLRGPPSLLRRTRCEGEL